MRLPDGEGLELVRHIAALAADLPVAVITAYGSAENAVAALKAGAFDYVSKPVGLEQLRALVKSALSLPDRADGAGQGPASCSARARRSAQVRELIAKLARTQAPVYISGESGSGKELAARLIHDNGARRDAAVRAGQLRRDPRDPDGERVLRLQARAPSPARTRTATASSRPRTAARCSSTRSPSCRCAMQVKLLRAIQEKRVRKVGATQEEPVDVRIICATHQNLAGMVEAGRFRQDLYYRLNVIELHDAAAARVPRGHPADRRQRILAAPGGAERRRAAAPLGAGARRADGATTSPATCASWRTSSSARSRSRRRRGDRRRGPAPAPHRAAKTPSRRKRAQAAPPATGEPLPDVPRPPGARGDPRRRSARPASTAPPRPSCSASPSASCATACSASASRGR